jgi:hypothetical protein
MVGVAITTEGECGLDMELQRATRSFHSPHAQKSWQFSSNEQLWINNQNDPNEAQAQLSTLRQSVLKLLNQMQDSPACCNCYLAPDDCAFPNWLRSKFYAMLRMS